MYLTSDRQDLSLSVFLSFSLSIFLRMSGASSSFFHYLFFLLDSSVLYKEQRSKLTRVTSILEQASSLGLALWASSSLQETRTKISNENKDKKKNKNKKKNKPPAGKQ